MPDVFTALLKWDPEIILGDELFRVKRSQCRLYGAFMLRLTKFRLWDVAGSPLWVSDWWIGLIKTSQAR